MSTEHWCLYPFVPILPISENPTVLTYLVLDMSNTELERSETPLSSVQVRKSGPTEAKCPRSPCMSEQEESRVKHTYMQQIAQKPITGKATVKMSN